MKTRIGVIAILALVALGLIALAIFLTKATADRARPIASDDETSASAAPRALAASRPSSGAIKPRPFPESEPADGSTSRAGALEIEVIGPTGRPASKALLVLHREREVLGRDMTNAEGLARLSAGEGEAELFIVPVGAPAHTTKISIEAGRRRVQLPAGVSITGRAEVNGELPRDPVTFSLYGPSVPLEGLTWSALGDTTQACTTDPSGAFELAGLREGSEWEFQSRLGYVIDGITRDGRPIISVPAPSTGIVIKLSRLPIIRGRVVSAERHLPVAGSFCWTVLQARDMAYCMNMPLGADGTFQFTAGYQRDPTAKIKRIEVTARGPQGIEGRPRILDPLPESDVDLGDLELPAVRTISFVVRDPAGVPIKDAYARLFNEVDPTSRTDAQGHGTITVGPAVTSFYVGALKYEVAEVQVPADIPGLLPVTLRPGAGLEVRLVMNPETPAASMRVRVSADTKDVVSTDALGNDATYVAAGATANHFGALGADTASFEFKPGADGRVVVAGLKSGIPLTIAAVDALDQVLTSTVVTLGAAEWKTIELRVTKTPRSFRGRVLDRKGQPVEGASVTMNSRANEVGANWSSGNSHRIACATDGEGRFTLSGIFQTRVHFAVDKSGYVPLIRRDFALPAEDTEAAFTLQTGCKLTVMVFAADGSPLRDLLVSADTEGFPMTYSEQKQPGVYVFVDFPPDVTATIRAEWTNLAWTKSVVVKGDQTERMTMPPTGKVVVDLSAVGPPPLELRLKPSAEEARPIVRWFNVPAAGSPPTRELEIPLVFAGDYTVTLQAEGFVQAAVPERVTVQAGQTTRIVLRKP